MLAHITDQHMRWIAEWFVAAIEKNGEAPTAIEPFLQVFDAGSSAGI